MNLKQSSTTKIPRWCSDGVCWILSMALLLNQSGCFHRYYKVEKDASPTTEKINRMKYAPNYIILHQSEKAWHLTDITINNDDKTVVGKLNTLPSDRYSYITTKPDKPNRYVKRDDKKSNTKPGEYVLEEVHIYLKADSVDISNGIIPLSSIDRLEIYDPDKGATTASYILGTLGVIVVAVGIAGLIASLSSCPFIYINNGKKYQFAGEIYAGAIYGCTERDDYMALPPEIASLNDEYALKIVNQLKERQYTNLAELIYVTHAKNTTVIPDKYGEFYSIANPSSPQFATNGGVDVTDLLKQNGDSKIFTFDALNANHNFNEVILSFDRPENTRAAKLVLNGKNSMWADYVFGEFTQLFGSYYNTWIKLQRYGSAKEHLQWMEDQNLILKIYLQTKKGWEYVDYIPLVGPLGKRDLVVPLNLPEEESKSVKIKVVSGYMFWELDYAGLDASHSQIFSSHPLSLSSAVNHEGKDKRSALLAADNHYLTQFEIGDETTLKFKVPEKDESVSSTLILHTRGYYEHIRDYDGIPDKEVLESFRNPGALSDFSRAKMEELEVLVQENEIFVSTK